MKTIRLSPVVIAAIIILFIIVVAKFARKHRVDEVNSLADQLRREISRDLKALRISKEKMNELNQRAENIFRQISAILVILFCGTTISVSIIFGVQIFVVLESATIGLAVIAGCGSLIILQKISINSLLVMIKKRIIIRIYKKNGFNPAIIDMLRSRIEGKKRMLIKCQSTNSAICI